jgi:phenylalanyl-tRNA synthetase beta chain
MLISHNWLKKYLPGIDGIGPDKLAEGLSQSLAEVENYKFIARDLENIVVGEIREITEIPDKSKLHSCLVDTGSGNNEIICGAPNVKPGLKVVPGDDLFSARTWSRQRAFHNYGIGSRRGRGY